MDPKYLLEQAHQEQLQLHRQQEQPPQQIAYPPQPPALYFAPGGQQQLIAVQVAPGGPQPLIAVQAVLYGPPPPPTYLAWSIVNLVMCCFPLGIASTLYSVNASKHIALGRYEHAREQANVARVLNIVATSLGSVLWIAAVIFLIVFFVVLVPQMH